MSDLDENEIQAANEAEHRLAPTGKHCGSNHYKSKTPCRAKDA